MLRIKKYIIISRIEYRYVLYKEKDSFNYIYLFILLIYVGIIMNSELFRTHVGLEQRYAGKTLKYFTKILSTPW